MKLFILIGILVFVLTQFIGFHMKEGGFRSFMFFLSFSVVQIIIWSGSLLLIRHYGSQRYGLFLAASLVFCLVADAALILAIRQTENNAALRMKNRQMENLLMARERHYDELKTKQEDMEKMQKDITESVMRVKTFIAKGETESAVAAIDKLKREQAVRPKYNVNGTVVEIFVEQRRCELEQKGIHLQSSIEIPALTGVTDVDIICAIGNMLDNAEEACADIPDAVIELSLQLKGEYLAIQCKNPSVKEVKEEKQRRVKELERGLGLMILRELAQKKDGDLNIRSDDGYFCVKLLLRAVVL